MSSPFAAPFGQPLVPPNVHRRKAGLLPVEERQAALLGLGARYDGNSLDVTKLTLFYSPGSAPWEILKDTERSDGDLEEALDLLLAEHEARPWAAAEDLLRRRGRLPDA